MDELSKEYVISFFDTNLMLHGDRPESVRWTPMGQARHYQAMLDMGDISGSKILDFGCGKGDFLQFLKDRSIPVEYTGWDINEKLISLALTKHPGVDFRVFDLDRDIPDQDFDYIFLCGVFNLRLQDINLTIKNSLKKLFARCRVGLAFNALSDHSPGKDFELNYTSPEDIFSFAVKELSPFVSLRHDRIAYDYTLFVYRNLNSAPADQQRLGRI